MKKHDDPAQNDAVSPLTRSPRLRLILALLILALASPALVSCGDEPAPPPPRSAKKKKPRRSGKERAESAISKSPLEPSQWEPISTRIEDRLNLVGGRNPFKGFADDRAAALERARLAAARAKSTSAPVQQLLPIQKYELRQLKLIAILTDLGTPTIQVLDPQGNTYLLKEGQPIGPPGTWIAGIYRDEVKIKSRPINTLQTDASIDTDLLQESEQCVWIRLHPPLDAMLTASRERRYENKDEDEDNCDIVQLYPKEFDKTEIEVHQRGR